MRYPLLITLSALAICSLGITCPPPLSPCQLPVLPDPAVVVSLTSSATLQAIPGADLTLTDGVLDYEMDEIAPAVYGGAYGVPGTFTLIVEAEDFQSITVENIVVEGEPCDVMTVELQFELDPV
ncbi:MAG TPA: hypothetical protein VJZ71_04025 [Phycisphaerae bacterium]|nr:hypothetical protein [Phycisphaerae bacterium]